MMKIVSVTLLCVFLTTGCTTLFQAKEATTELAGSLYAPKHYIDEDFSNKLKTLQTGSAMSANELNFLFTNINTINKNYAKYISILTSGKAAANVTYDSLNLALTGGSAVAVPLATKTGLAALSTFFQGQKQSIDKNIFSDQAIYSLTSIMEIRRTAVMKKIRKSLESSTYKLGEALIDLDEFYRAGSLQNALQASFLNQAASSEPGKGESLLPPSTNTK